MRIHHFGDELDDVARGAKLPVLSGGADLIKKHLVDVTLYVLEEVTFLTGFALNFEKYFFDDDDGTL